MEQEKHLPTIHFHPTLATLFVNALGKAVSVTEARLLTAMPVPEARAVVVSKLSSLGQTITREEVEQCLWGLSLAVPSAAISREDTRLKVGLYHSLFERHGVTYPMLQQACAAYAMAPLKGRPKFFPDPGALYELMQDDARYRHRSQRELLRALDVLDGKSGAAPEPEYVSARTIGDLAARMGARPHVPEAPQAQPPTGKSDPTALLAALEARGVKIVPKDQTTKEG